MFFICFGTIKLDKAFYWTVEAYMRRHEMSPTSFGQRSLGDPCFLADLTRGRSPSLGTADKVLVFMGFAPLGQAFVDDVKALLDITGIKSSELGYAATGNPSFVNRLRRGTSPRLTTVDQIRSWIVKNSSAEEHRAIRDHCASKALCQRGVPLPFDHVAFIPLNTRLLH